MSDRTERINDLTERLADVFLTEADPDNWSGAGVHPTEMDPQTRGARNWDAKNANQVGALLMRTLELRERFAGLPGFKPTGEDDRADANIAKYEREAKRLLDTVSQRRGS